MQLVGPFCHVFPSRYANLFCEGKANLPVVFHSGPDKTLGSIPWILQTWNLQNLKQLEGPENGRCFVVFVTAPKPRFSNGGRKQRKGSEVGLQAEKDHGQSDWSSPLYLLLVLGGGRGRGEKGGKISSFSAKAEHGSQHHRLLAFWIFGWWLLGSQVSVEWGAPPPPASV